MLGVGRKGLGGLPTHTFFFLRMIAMTYVVHGASGAQGAPVLAALEKRGFPVLGIGRQTQDSKQSRLVGADCNSSAELEGVYRDASGVFVHLPLGPAEIQLQWAKNIGAALVAAKPARIVVSTSGEIVDRPDCVLQRAENTALPTLFRMLDQAGLSYAVVAPRLFQENLLGPYLFKDVMNTGVLCYPLRASMAVSWVSHLDVAEVVAALFEQPEVRGIVAVGQSPALTGDKLAEEFGKALKKDVVYEEISPEDFGGRLTPYMGEGPAMGVTQLYRDFSRLDHHGIDVNRSAQELLGLKPRSVSAWLAEVVG